MSAPAVRPSEPAGDACVWYRGWEAGWSMDREFWTGAGYVAYKGGADIGAREVSASTWNGLLDEIEGEEA